MSSYQHTLVVDEGPLKGRRYPVTLAGLKLGRSSQSDIAISDPLLSRSHCRFELRGDDLWVCDLASANQTLLNDVPVDEAKLAPGDLIKVGENVLRVERAEFATATLADADAPRAESPDVVIDLGFGKDDADAAHAKKNFLRPLIWSLAAVLILIVGTTLILDPARRGKAQAGGKPQSLEQEKTLLLAYEKVEATADSIFRFEMSVTPGGLLSVKIDDLGKEERHVPKEKQLEPELLAELARDIEGSGFFLLDRTYTGYAPHPNTLNEWTLTAVIGKKAHTCRVTNRQEPDSFRALREKLETFSKNELGIWAIQFSAEKLTGLAATRCPTLKKNTTSATSSTETSLSPSGTIARPSRISTPSTPSPTSTPKSSTGSKRSRTSLKSGTRNSVSAPTMRSTSPTGRPPPAS